MRLMKLCYTILYITDIFELCWEPELFAQLTHRSGEYVNDIQTSLRALNLEMDTRIFGDSVTQHPPPPQSI